MTPQQLEVRQKRSATEPLVISETEEGFQIYSTATPKNLYTVGGDPESPTCTCPDFQTNQDDPEWRCKHILAVLSKRGVGGTESDPPEAEEARAIQTAGSPRANDGGPANGTSQMLIKRSVSPDGRIDSLSVEFTCPVSQATAGEIKNRAVKALGLQSEIVREFLQTNGKGRGRNGSPAADSGVSAELVDIGATNTRWGRRLFINVKANGRTMKYFGTEKQLADAIAAAGYPDRTEFVDAGVKLGLPCRVETKQNGKYLNVERVLPVSQAPRQTGARA